MFKFLLLFLLLFSYNYAEPFHSNSYHYYKELTLKDISKVNSSSQYGRVILDEEVIRYSGNNDRRLVYNEKTIPFFTRTVTQEKGSPESKTPKVVFNETNKYSTIFVLQFPDIPENMEYKEIHYKDNGSTYEASVAVSLGEDPKNWQNTEHYNIHNYSDENNNQIKQLEFHSGRYRYARLEFNTSEPQISNIQFIKVVSYPITKELEYSNEVKLTELKNRTDSDKQASIYYYDNPLKRPIHKIKLQFQEERYKRTIHVYEYFSKSYSTVASTIIEKKSADKPTEKIINFNKVITDKFKIEILDGDDSPLKLTFMEIYSPMQELIFQLPSKEDLEQNQSIRLYYGNPYAYFPVFDLANTYNKDNKLLKFELSPHTKNDKFAYSAVQPPVSSWIIRISYIVGLLLISFPAFKAFKKYSLNNM